MVHVVASDVTETFCCIVSVHRENKEGAVGTDGQQIDQFLVEVLVDEVFDVEGNVSSSPMFQFVIRDLIGIVCSSRADIFLPIGCNFSGDPTGNIDVIYHLKMQFLGLVDSDTQMFSSILTDFHRDPFFFRLNILLI